jgi:hypothetical protein
MYQTPGHQGRECVRKASGQNWEVISQVAIVFNIYGNASVQIHASKISSARIGQKVPRQFSFSSCDTYLRVRNFLGFGIFWYEWINRSRTHDVCVLLSNLVRGMGSILGGKLLLLDMCKTASLSMDILDLARSLSVEVDNLLAGLGPGGLLVKRV